MADIIARAMAANAAASGGGVTPEEFAALKQQVNGIKTYEAFKPSWNNSTIEKLIQSVYNDPDVSAGKAYLGEITRVTSSEGLFNGNAELMVNIMTNSKVMWLVVSSSNVDPYHWEATAVSGHLSIKGWTPFVPATRTIAGKNLKSNISAEQLRDAILPNAPELDGEYVLVCKVVDGDATYEW